MNAQSVPSPDRRLPARPISGGNPQSPIRNPKSKIAPFLHHFFTDFHDFKKQPLDYQQLAKLFAPRHGVPVGHASRATNYAPISAPFLHRFFTDFHTFKKPLLDYQPLAKLSAPRHFVHPSTTVNEKLTTDH